MTCGECGAQVGAVTELCHQCGAPVAAGALVHMHAASAEHAGFAMTATARLDDLIARPSARTGIALGGAAIALISGVAGVMSFALFDTRYPNLVSMLLFLAAYVVPATVAGAALMRVDRLAIVALLLGMSLPAVAYLAEDVVNPSVDHLLSFTGRTLAAYSFSVASDALGATAAVLLVIFLVAAMGRPRRVSGRLPLATLFAVLFGQLAVLIFWIKLIESRPEAYALGIVELLAGLAVTWYGMTLRDARLGGTLVLGWAVGAVLPVVGFVFELPSGIPMATGAIGSVLLGAAAALAVVHIRTAQARPADLHMGLTTTNG